MGEGVYVTASAFKVLNSSSCRTVFHLDSGSDGLGTFRPLVGNAAELDWYKFRTNHIGRAMVSLSYLCMYLSYEGKASKKQEGVWGFFILSIHLSPNFLRI